jgi:hypothetical protein
VWLTASPTLRSASMPSESHLNQLPSGSSLSRFPLKVLLLSLKLLGRSHSRAHAHAHAHAHTRTHTCTHTHTHTHKHTNTQTHKHTHTNTHTQTHTHTHARTHTHAHARHSTRRDTRTHTDAQTCYAHPRTNLITHTPVHPPLVPAVGTSSLWCTQWRSLSSRRGQTTKSLGCECTHAHVESSHVHK